LGAFWTGFYLNSTKQKVKLLNKLSTKFDIKNSDEKKNIFGHHHAHKSYNQIIFIHGNRKPSTLTEKHRGNDKNRYQFNQILPLFLRFSLKL
jgi:hypothetical protein